MLANRLQVLSFCLKERGDISMAVKIMIAFMLSFLISIGFGRFFVPWLKRHSFSQPLKEEIAQMYERKDNDTNKGNELNNPQ